jgi:hypothetical protein
MLLLRAAYLNDLFGEFVQRMHLLSGAAVDLAFMTEAA